MPDDAKTRRESISIPTEEDLNQGAHLRVAGWKVFGRYTLESRLGHGGMSVVWRAHDELLGESVALKFLPKIVARDPVAVDDLRQKTARARTLDHPHIARANDFMRDNTLATVSMEYVEGMTLEQQRLEQPGQVFSAAALAPLIGQLCSALEYAHESATVVHGRLKPTNILVGPDGNTKLTDFGVACSLAEARRRLMRGSEPIFGSSFYVSPQQSDGNPPGYQDDIYSFGAVLYELLVGEPPTSIVDVVTQMCIQESVGMAARQTEPAGGIEPIPAAWKKLVAACLARDPSQRPTSWGEIMGKLGIERPAGPYWSSGD